MTEASSCVVDMSDELYALAVVEKARSTLNLVTIMLTSMNIVDQI